MSNIIDKPLYILNAALEEKCAPLTIRREIQLGRIKAELEIVNGRPTWIIDRSSFAEWSAKRKVRESKLNLDENGYRGVDGLDEVLDHRLEQFEQSMDMDDADFGGEA